MGMGMIVLAAAFKVFWVDAFSSVPFLPDADPKGGVETNALSLAAAQGEIETVSFVVHPLADLAKVDFIPTALVGPEGATLPAEAVEFSLVKVWFRPDIRWTSSWLGNINKPTPIGTLVLHDDALVKVDFEKKVNYLRAEYPGGTRYLNISRKDRDTHFNHDLEPVRDAPKFVPMDLKRDFRQQFWVTVRVPESARPGVYRGSLRAVCGGKDLQTLPLTVEVYPFRLPSPRTHYDTSRPYYSYWMGSPTLQGLVDGSHELARSERKLRAIFRSMKEHNAANVASVGDLVDTSTDNLAVRTLIIARQEGLLTRPLISGRAYGDGGFVWSPDAPQLDPAEHKEEYAKSLAAFRKDVERQNGVLDRLLGHHDCYYSSVDECRLQTNRRSFGYWSIVKELGGMIWTDYANPRELGFAVDLNDTPAFVDHRAAYEWHAQGGRCTTYAGPFTGPECPDIWRRTKGMRYWYADYDGQHEYCFYDGTYNRWNDFNPHEGGYCQFGIVYLTEDGLVSTLAWEGMREGLDDVRYFTLLRRRAEAAMAAKDPETVKLGRAALHWQDSVDPEYVLDLYAFRRQTVGWILRLMEKVGPEPAERPVDTAVELPPCTAKDGPNRWDLEIVRLVKEADDASRSPSDQVKTALRLKELYVGLYRRDEALASIDRVLSLPKLEAAERGRLLLARAQTMVTPATFEETFGKDELDKASEWLAKALKVQDISEADRFAAVERIAKGYCEAGDGPSVISFVADRLADARLSGPNRARLIVYDARVKAGQGDWTAAARSYAAAFREAGGADKIFMREHASDAALAEEKAGNWKAALRYYTDLLPCYTKEEAAKQKWVRGQIARVSREVSSKSSGPSVSPDGDEEAISLEE